MIAVTFPCPPTLYPVEQQYSWSQISHYVYHALVKAFPNEEVRFFPSGSTIPLSGRDFLVSNVTDHTRDYKRCVIVDNDNLDDDKWLKGRFLKYGMNHRVDRTEWTKPYMEGALAILLKTNDCAIKRWNENDPAVAKKKAWLLSATPAIHVLPHPIDKQYFGSRYDADWKFDKAKMLVYHTGPHKNAKELIELLFALGLHQHFTVLDNIVKTPAVHDYIIREFMLFAHVSVSEGFPYLANEFMCDGMLLYGHEEWWDGYGESKLTWSYDPARRDENAEKLRSLFKPSNREAMHALRRRIRDHHVARKDNEWSYFTGILVDEVRKHL